MSDQCKPDIFDAVSAFVMTKKRSDEYLNIFAEWCRFLGGYPREVADQIATATITHAQLYREYLLSLPGKNVKGKKTKSAGATVSKKIYILRKIYHILQAQELVQRNPFAVVTPPSQDFNRKRETKHIPFDKAKEMLDQCDDTTQLGIRDKAILAVMLGGGLRRGEVVGLTLDDVKVSENGTPYLRLKETKAQQVARQALPSWANEAVIDWLLCRRKMGARDEHKLFVSVFGHGTRHGRSMDEKSVSRLVKKHVARVGLDPREYSPHSLRATYGSKLDDAGATVQDIQKALRHTSPITTIKYLKSKHEVEDSVGKTIEF